GAGSTVGIARSATCKMRAVDTISRAGTCDRLDGIAPAAISCSAMEIANATVNRRPATVPKKTPSRS
ncbi:MAG TPA: hypothetical protein VKE42_02355, partial [Candidatus Cybelea sp.]|nr:hypothetical protein [Candidatus Cybelea sp.]